VGRHLGWNITCSESNNLLLHEYNWNARRDGQKGESVLTDKKRTRH